MKRLMVSLMILCLVSLTFAGGIVTNTNQSAAYLRTLNRNASTDVDAVYSNPAGITQLGEGLHIGLSNQSIFQLYTVENDYGGSLPATLGSLPYGLNEAKYEGTVTALVYPDLYVVYNMGNFAFSAGFMPIGGGGSVEFDKGLPSFEIPVSDLVPGLQAEGQSVSAYSLDADFKGNSIYYGGQAGIALKINEMLSISVGGRYVYASNKYEGHLKDIKINLDGSDTRADAFFTGVAGQYSAGATSAYDAASSLGDASTAGYGGLTFAEAEAGGIFTAEEVAALQGGLGDNYFDGMTIDQAGGTYTALGNGATDKAEEAGAKSQLLADQEADVTQTGSGFAPVISVNFTPNENLLVSFRYEGLVRLELENDTKKDITTGFSSDGTPVTQFPNGAITYADMPAMMGLGIAYTVSPKLKTEASYNYYMNSGVDWGGRENDVENGYEAGLSVEYTLNEKLKASVGFLNADGGAKSAYQTDMSYSLKSNTIGLGINYAINEKLSLDIGALNTFYGDDKRDGTHELMTGVDLPYTETYNKTTNGFAFGLNYQL